MTRGRNTLLKLLYTLFLKMQAFSFACAQNFSGRPGSARPGEKSPGRDSGMLRKLGQLRHDGGAARAEVGMGWQTFLAFVSSMISKEAVLGVTSVLFTGAGSIWEATATGAADANIGQIIAASISKPEALAFILAVNFNVPCLMAR